MSQWCELRWTTEMRRRKKFLAEYGITTPEELMEKVPLRYTTAEAFMNGEYISENTIQKIYRVLSNNRFKVRGRRYLKIDRKMVDKALGTRIPLALIYKHRDLTMYMARQLINRDELSPQAYKMLCEITKCTPGAFLVYEE